MSATNGSSSRCAARVAGDNFELSIYSGRDRIWSSKDCSTAFSQKRQQLAAKQAVRWQLKWNGRRSAPRCANRPETPRPGTYLVTAQLRGAAPVQRRLILRG